jgi:hypothetical protein
MILQVSTTTTSSAPAMPGFQGAQRHPRNNQLTVHQEKGTVWILAGREKAMVMGFI